MLSLGRDLQSIRKHLGYTVEDIQNATKLPLDTIRSIEDGSIFTESKEITTYIRSFVRTYARALKIDSELMAQALDQEELGNYTNLLLTAFPELLDEEPEKQEPKEDKESEKKSSTKKKKSRSPSFKFGGDNDDRNTSSRKTIAPNASRARSNTKEPDVHSINWAGLGQDFKKNRTQPPVWIISAAVLVIIIIAVAVIISQFGLFSSQDDIPVEPPATDVQESTQNQDLTLDLSDDMTEEALQESVIALSDTLYLTVYAATDRLDPVRLWSDLKPRIDPYWLDQGTAYNFEFSDTIRVSGSYSNMLLFLNGNRIDNFRGQYYNPEESAVELTRSIFDSDPEWATPTPFELPDGIPEPDTLMNRPSFP